MRAIEFGLGVNNPGFNIFVTGLTGTGKTSIIKAFLKKMTSKHGMTPEDSALPDDWCYLDNFSDPDRPRALGIRRLGKIFKRTWNNSSNPCSGKPRKCSKVKSSQAIAGNDR